MAEDSKPRNLFDDFCSAVTEDSLEKESSDTVLFADASISSGHKDINHKTKKCVTDSKLDEIGSSPKPNNEIQIKSSINFVGVEQESEGKEGNDIKFSDNLVGLDNDDIKPSKNNAEKNNSIILDIKLGGNIQSIQEGPSVEENYYLALSDVSDYEDELSKNNIPVMEDSKCAEKNASIVLDIKIGGNNQNIQEEDPSVEENYFLELSDVSDYEEELGTKKIPVKEDSKCDDDFDSSGSFLIIDEYKCEENSEEELKKIEVVKCKSHKSLETNDSNIGPETVSNYEQPCSSSAAKTKGSDIQLETVHDNDEQLSSKSTADDEQIEKNKSNIQSASSDCDTNNQSVANYCDTNKQLSEKDIEIGHLVKQFESNDDHMKLLERIDTDRILEAIDKQLEKIDNKDKLEKSDDENQLETIDSGKPLKTSDNDKSLEPNHSVKQLHVTTIGEDKQLDSNKPLHLQTNHCNKLLQTNDVDQPLATHASDSDKQSETKDNDNQLTTNISEKLLETKDIDKHIDTKDSGNPLKTSDNDKPLEPNHSVKQLTTSDEDKQLDSSVTCSNKPLHLQTNHCNKLLQTNDVDQPLASHASDSDKQSETKDNDNQLTTNISDKLLETKDIDKHIHVDTKDIDKPLETKNIDKLLKTMDMDKPLETSDSEKKLNVSCKNRQLTMCNENSKLDANDTVKLLKVYVGDKLETNVRNRQTISNECKDLATSETVNPLETKVCDKLLSTCTSGGDKRFDGEIMTKKEVNTIHYDLNKKIGTNYSHEQIETNVIEKQLKAFVTEEQMATCGINKKVVSRDGDKQIEAKLRIEQIESICYDNQIETNDSNKSLKTDHSDKEIKTHISHKQIETHISHKQLETNDGKNPLETNDGKNPLETNDCKNPLEANYSENQFETDYCDDQIKTYNIDKPLNNSDSCSNCKLYDETVGEDKILEICDSYKNKQSEMSPADNIKHLEASCGERLLGIHTDTDIDSNKHLETICGEKLLNINGEHSVYRKQEDTIDGRKQSITLNCETTLLSCTKKNDQDEHLECQLPKESNDVDDITMLNYAPKCHIIEGKTMEGLQASGSENPDHSKAEMEDPNTVVHNSKLSENLKSIEEDSFNNYESMKTSKITEFSHDDHSAAKLADLNTLVHNYKASESLEHNTLQEYSGISSEATKTNQVTDAPEDEISNNELDDLQEDHSSDNHSIGDSENMDEDSERPFSIDFSVEQIGDDQYKCSCGFIEKENSFIKHLIIHHLVNKPYRCSYCKICLERKKDIRKHHTEAHQSNPEKWYLIGIKKAKRICTITSQKRSYVHKPSKTSDQIISSRLQHLKSSDDIDTKSSSNRMSFLSVRKTSQDVVLTNERQSNDNVSKAVTDQTERHRSFGNTCIKSASSSEKNRLLLNRGRNTHSIIETYQNYEKPKSKSYPPMYNQTLDVNCGPPNSVGSLLSVPVSNTLYLMPLNSTPVTSTSVVNAIGPKASEEISLTIDHPSAVVASRGYESASLHSETFTCNSHMCTSTVGVLNALYHHVPSVTSTSVANATGPKTSDAIKQTRDHPSAVVASRGYESASSHSETSICKSQICTTTDGVAVADSINTNAAASIKSSCIISNSGRTAAEHEALESLHAPTVAVGNYGASVSSISKNTGGYNQLLTLGNSVSCDKPGSLSPNVKNIHEIVKRITGVFKFLDGHYICLSCHTKWPEKTKFWWHVWFHFHQGKKLCSKCNGDKESLTCSKVQQVMTIIDSVRVDKNNPGQIPLHEQNQGNTDFCDASPKTTSYTKVKQDEVISPVVDFTRDQSHRTMTNENHQNLSTSQSTSATVINQENQVNQEMCSNEIQTMAKKKYQELSVQHSRHTKSLSKEICSNDNHILENTAPSRTSPEQSTSPSTFIQHMNDTGHQRILSSTLSHQEVFSNENKSTSTQNHQTSPTKQSMDFSEMQIEVNLSGKKVVNSTSLRKILPKPSEPSSHLVNLLSSNENRNNHSQLTRQTNQESVCLIGLIQTESSKIDNASSLASQVKSNTSPWGVLSQQSESSPLLINLLSSNGNGNNHSQFTQQTKEQSMFLNGLIKPGSPKIDDASSPASQVENNTSPHRPLHQHSGPSIHLINLLSTNQPVTSNINSHSVSSVTTNQETCSMSMQPSSDSIENPLSVQQPLPEQRLETGARDTPVNIVKKFIANNGVMNTPKNMTSEEFEKKKLEIARGIKTLLQNIREENNTLVIPDPPQNKANKYLMSLDLLSKIMVNAADSSKVSQYSCSNVGVDATPKQVDVAKSSEFVAEPVSFVPEMKPILFKCKQDTKPPQFYACSFCRFSTLIHTKFKKHLLSEHRQLSITCVHCGFKSKAVEVFIKHLQRHTQAINPRIPAFKCLSERCFYQCNTLNDFIKHLKTHDNYGHKCHNCDQQFATLEELHQHYKSSFFTTVSCPTCRARSTDKQSILDHISRHHPNKGRMVSVLKQLICKARIENDFEKMGHIQNEWDNPDSDNDDIQILESIDCETSVSGKTDKDLGHQNEEISADLESDKHSKPALEIDKINKPALESDKISKPTLALESDKISKPALESEKINIHTLESDKIVKHSAESDKHIICSAKNGKNANYGSKNLETNKYCNKDIAANTQQIEPSAPCPEIKEGVDHEEAVMSRNIRDSSSYDFGLKCDFCTFVANRSTSLDNHIAKHNQCQISTHPKDFCCTICPATFNELADLENHLQHHDEKISFTLYECNVDEYKSNVYSNIISHLKEHHRVSCDNKDMYSEGTVVLESKVIQCPDCAYKCVNKTVLTEHLKKHNRSRTKKSKSRLSPDTDIVDSNTNVHIVYPESKVNSQKGKYSDLLDSIVSELYTHENCSYLCKVCQKSLKFKKALHVHICYHIDIPFKCAKCAFSAKQLAQVISHVKDEHSAEDVSISFSDKMKDRVKSLLAVTKTAENSTNHVDPKPALKPRRKFFVRGSSGIISITVNKKNEEEYSEQLDAKDNASPTRSVNPERAEGCPVDLLDTSDTEGVTSPGLKYQVGADYNSANEELSKNTAKKPHNTNKVKTKMSPKSTVGDISLFMTSIDESTQKRSRKKSGKKNETNSDSSRLIKFDTRLTDNASPVRSVNPEHAEGCPVDVLDTSNTGVSTSSNSKYQVGADYNNTNEELSKNKARKPHNTNNVKTKMSPKPSVDDVSLFMTSIDESTQKRSRNKSGKKNETDSDSSRLIKFDTGLTDNASPAISVNPEHAEGCPVDVLDTSNTGVATSSNSKHQVGADYNNTNEELSKNKARKPHNTNNVKTKMSPKPSVDDISLFMTNIDESTQKRSRNKSGKKETNSDRLIKFDTGPTDNGENQKTVPAAKLLSQIKDNSNTQLSSSQHRTLISSPKCSKSTFKKKRCSSPLKLKMNFKLKRKSLLPSNYKCPKCDFITSFDEEVMKTHLKQHKQESVYECNKCSVKFHSFQQIEIHSNVLHHGEVDYRPVPVLNIPLKGFFKKVTSILTNKPQTGVNYNSKREIKQIPNVDDEGKAVKQSCETKDQRPKPSFKTASKMGGRSDTDVSIEGSSAMKRKSLGDGDGTAATLFCEASTSNELPRNKPDADGSIVLSSRQKDKPGIDEPPNKTALKRKPNESVDKAAKRLCTRDGNAAYELCTPGTSNEEMIADETGSGVTKEVRTKCDEDQKGAPDVATTERSGNKKSHKGDLRPSLFVVKKGVKTKKTASLDQSNMQIGCRYCHQLFTSIFNIAKHVSIRHVRKKVLWTDTLSGCVFNETGTHMKSSENCYHQNKFLCGHCEFRGNTRGSVKNHLKDVHSGNFKNWIKLSGGKEEPPSTQLTESKAGHSRDQQAVGIKYNCPVCKYKIGKLDVFSRHLAKHKRFKKISKVWMWKCNSCSLTIAKKKKAEEHPSKCSLKINDSESIVRLNVIRMVDLKPSLILTNDAHHLV